MVSFSYQIVKPVEGSGGAQSEVTRFNRINPKFAKGLGFVNKIAAGEAERYNAAPLVQLKRDVRRLLEESKYGLLPPLPEVTHRGFDWNGEYDSGKITDADKSKEQEAKALLDKWWRERMNPKEGWQEVLGEDKSPLLELGVMAISKYVVSKGGGCGGGG